MNPLFLFVYLKQYCLYCFLPLSLQLSETVLSNSTKAAPGPLVSTNGHATVLTCTMRVTCYRAAHPSSWRLPQQLPNQLLPQSRNMRAQVCPLSQPSLFPVQLWLIRLECHRHLLLTFLPTANLYTHSGIRCSMLMCIITLRTSIQPNRC